MTRKEFIKNSAILSLGLPFFSSFLTSCSQRSLFAGEINPSFNGKVLIVGAGSAGLMAGYLLKRYGIDFQIIEASSVYGGRVKKAANFADFPIDLGAEWIHTNPQILSELLDEEDAAADIDIIRYNPQSLWIWSEGKLKKRSFFTEFYSEYKFASTTWYEFFEQYVVPSIADDIIYDAPVATIDYAGDEVKIQTRGGDNFSGDKVIVTVPLTVLQNEDIQFTPSYPAEKKEALSQVDMPDGIKVFMEFSERFYPDLLGFNSLGNFLNAPDGERIYYDAAFKKDTTRHILGLFTVGAETTPYAEIATDEELITYILAELDEIFEGKASQTYIQHVSQNWSQEPFIRGSYTHYEDYSVQQVLAEPIDGKVYFAGEAYPEASSTVYGAGISAFTAVEAILQS
ncbi:MAG: NAD(P)/FAD-dependent oxidoreductase [Bacteroidota bacterium]